jgi:hypothetical protein
VKAYLPVSVAALAAIASGAFLIATGARAGLDTAFVAVAAGSLVIVLWLLWRAGRALVVEPPAEEVRVATGRRRKELEREKQLLLKALKELEFDHEMRKISDGDYQEIAGQYRARALRVMRQLDEVGEDYRAVIERDLGKPKPAKEDAPARRGGCPKCETENDSDALFCKRCATRLVVEEATS